MEHISQIFENTRKLMIEKYGEETYNKIMAMGPPCYPELRPKMLKKDEEEAKKSLFTWHDTNDDGILLQHRYGEEFPTVMAVEERKAK